MINHIGSLAKTYAGFSASCCLDIIEVILNEVGLVRLWDTPEQRELSRARIEANMKLKTAQFRQSIIEREIGETEGRAVH